MFSKVYISPQFYDKFTKIDDIGKKRILNVVERLVNNYSNSGLDIKVIKYRKEKILRKHIARNPDLILLFDILNEQKEKFLILWNIIKHDDYKNEIKYFCNIKNVILNGNENFLKIDFEEIEEFNDCLEENYNEENDNLNNNKFYFGKWYYVLNNEHFINILENYAKENFLLEPLFTSQQLKALNSPHPTLIQGTSGTGKTLILLEKLVLFYKKIGEVNKDNLKIGYLTLFPKVSRGIKEYFSKNIKELENFEFKGVYELFEEIIQYNNNEIYIKKFSNKSKKVDYDIFLKEWYSIRRGNFKIEPEILWQEIRGKILGKSKKRILSEEEYIKTLNYKNIDYVFDKNTLKDIYKAALNYDDWKKERKLWDYCDLSWECINLLKNYNFTLFDALAVDEVQDLNEREIFILIKLCKNLNIFFAGDINQKLYPSSFLWSYVIDAIRNIKPNFSTSPLILTLNFRCKRKIVEYGNFILRQMRNIERENDLRVNAIEQETIDTTENEDILFLKFDSFNSLKNKILSFEESPHLVFISPTQEYKIDGVNFFFSIDEFKGLESKQVILVNFFKWLRESNNYNSFFYNMHILQRFYVAITRAIETLVFFDEEDFLQEFRDYLKFVYDIDKDFLIIEGKVEDWEKRGYDYEKYDKVKEALLCFKKAAEMYENESKEYEKAAFLYETKLKNYQKARDCYYKSKKWNDCIRVCKEINDNRTIGDIYENHLEDLNKAKEYYLLESSWEDYARVCEKLGEYEEAGEIYENELLDYEKARDCYYKSKKWDNCIRVCKEINDNRTIGNIYEYYLGDINKAREYYFLAESWEDYSRICEKLEEYEEAGDIYENKLKEKEKAKELYNKAKNQYRENESWEDYARICEKLEEYEEAGDIYENKLKEKEKARDCYYKSQKWNDCIRVCKEINDNRTIGNIYENYLMDLNKAKEYYLLAESWKEYVRVCESLDDIKEAASVYENKLKDLRKAKIYYKKLELWDDFIRVCENLRDYENLAKVYEIIKKDYYTAKYYYKKLNKWEDTIRMCIMINKYNELKEAAEIYEYNLYNFDNAKELYKKLELWNDYGRICERKGEYKEAAFIYEEKTFELEKALLLYTRTKSFEDVARIYLKLEKYKDAIDIYENKLNDLKTVAKIYEEKLNDYIMAIRYFFKVKAFLDVLRNIKKLIITKLNFLKSTKKNKIEK